MQLLSISCATWDIFFRMDDFKSCLITSDHSRRVFIWLGENIHEICLLICTDDMKQIQRHWL